MSIINVRDNENKRWKKSKKNKQTKKAKRNKGVVQAIAKVWELNDIVMRLG